MFASIAFVVVSSAVPSPGRVILDSVSVAPSFLIAQTDPPSREEEEKNLEDDMDAARQKTAPKVETPPANPYAVQEGEVDPPPAPKAKPPKKRRLEATDRPSIDGHSRGYYLAWGLGQWVLAGGLWAVSGVSTLYSVFFGIVAANPEATADGTAGWEVSEKDAHNIAIFGAIFYGALAIGGAVFGTWVSSKAVYNISNYGELKRQERELRGVHQAEPPVADEPI